MAYAKRIGPGISKLTDRAIPGVFLGYEPGSKAYRIYDPVNKKLMISRDVVFNEKKGWNWGEKGTGVTEANTATEPVFSVFYPDEQVSVAGPTIGDAAEDLDALGDLGEASEPASPVQSIPSPGGAGGESPYTPEYSIGGSNGGNQIQWAMPPTDGAVDSEGAPLRYRTIPNLLDTTNEVQLEYSGVCLVAAEEPSSVDQALTELC